MDKELLEYESRIKKELDEEFIKQSSYIFYPNLYSLRLLAYNVVNTLEPYANRFNSEEGYKEFPVYTLEERLKIIDKFYKYIDCNVDVYDLFNKGIFSFEGLQYEEELLNERINIPYTGGVCRYCKEQKISIVDVKNTGYFIDCTTAVHELSHYQDEKKEGLLHEVNEFMTEAIADSYELMLMDYYEEEHPDEILWIKRSRLRYYHKVSEACLELLDVFYLYYNFNDISSELYQNYLGKNDYADMLKRMKEKHIPMDITITEYLVCAALAPYLYYEYKKDKRFADTIKSLHKSILDEDFPLLLRKIHLDTFINPLTNELEIDYSKSGNKIIANLEEYASNLYASERRR